MALLRTTAPATTPVTLAEVKLHSRIDYDVEDSLLTAMIGVAVDQMEGSAKGDKGFLGRALLTQTWQLSLQDFPSGDELELPKPPLQSVTSVTYKNTDGEVTTLPSSIYEVDTVREPGRIVLKDGESWPTVGDYLNAVTVTFVCGYTSLPEPLKMALLLLVKQQYDSVRTGDKLAYEATEKAITSLTANYKVRWV